MTRIFDWLVEAWDRIRGLLGFHRFTRKGRGDDLSNKGPVKRVYYFIRPVIMLLVLIYLGTMIWRFSWIRGEDLNYPQALITAQAPAAASGTDGAETQSAAATGQTCQRSQIVDVQVGLLDLLVNQNDWAPATPQYKAGLFFITDWASTPFFDNKASFQIGALGAVRRMSIELTDTLGRVRGTSEADPDLVAARGRLQIDETTWILNPFNDRLPLWGTSAASNYGDAIDLFQRFNARLTNCDALFDARADNLFQLLDRVSKDLGSLVDQIGKRSQGRVYDVATHSFIDGEGNNAGWFDLRADNLFHEARGRMYAYHGLMQGARIDFADVLVKRDLTDVWNRMEARIAETAALSPLIVSNGREDGFMMPDHLSAMAENVLRARANIVELRDILDR